MPRANDIPPEHHCHWPGCQVKTPPKLFACKMHWYMIPAHLRAGIWAAYVPGQEIRKDPTRAYMMAVRAVYDWVRENHPESFTTQGQLF